MKIAIDATRAVIEQAGIGRYTFEIVKNLLKIDHKNEYLIYFTHFRDDEAKTKKMAALSAPNAKLKRIKIPGNLKESLWKMPFNLPEKYLEGADVLFAPSFLEVNLAYKIPQVVTIHDMTTFLFPDQRGEEVSKRLNKRTELAVKKAKKIICISKSTQSDLLKFTHIPQDKIETIPLASSGFEKIGQLPRELKNKNYILTVGTIEPRKNLIGLFRAYALLSSKMRQKYILVVAGGKGWQTNPIFKEVKKLGIENKIRFLGYVEDEGLAALYKGAALFAYPSLYEGFGLPPLEALSFGKPVLTSNISSLPEVTGDAAILVNPEDPKDIAAGLEKILQDRKLQENLSKKALEQAKKFSWKKCASQTLEILEEAGNDQ